MDYRPTWNMATVPDKVLFEECGRRRSMKRATKKGGRKITKTTAAAAANRERVRKFREKQRKLNATK